MHKRDHRWALVLAGGEGRRLQGLTTTSSGVAVPKQFCSLDGGPSLLHAALERARAATPSEQICTIVAEQHRRLWRGRLEWLAVRNVIVQPRNRGTANGILLPLLHILERDPDARIVLLPSDHHVRDERALARTLDAAAAPAESDWAEILLLGVEPQEADPELGYILPGPGDGSTHRPIERFVEKPSVAVARELIEGGGLWNMFIIAADAQALLRLFERRCPDIVAEMQAIIRCGPESECYRGALAELYDALPELDFSRQILTGHEQKLRVLTVPPCGWSDLGTPHRVVAALQSLTPRKKIVSARPSIDIHGVLSLSAQHQRLGITNVSAETSP